MALARKVGNRFWERLLIGELTYPLFTTGRWEEATSLAAQIPEHEVGSGTTAGLLVALPELHVGQGNPGEARKLLVRFTAFLASADVQDRALHAAATAALLHAEGRHPDAMAAGEAAFQARRELGADAQAVKAGFTWAAEAAFALADLGKVQELLGAVEALPPGHRPPLLQAQAARVSARLAVAQGQRDGVQAGFKAAAGMLRELGVPFWLAVTLLEHAEWLAKEEDAQRAELLRTEAGAIFQRLGARPWLERLAIHRTGLPVPAGRETSASSEQR